MTAINNEFYSTKRTRPCCLAISLNKRETEFRCVQGFFEQKCVPESGGVLYLGL